VSNAGGARITQTGLSLGTPQYMSPEQATGDHVIDGRTDLYSLGAIAYEMLTGDPPHTGSTAQAIIAHLLTEQPRPIRRARSSVPSHVDNAVTRALEKLPADRWTTAVQFVDALTGRAPTTSMWTHPDRARDTAGWRGVVRHPIVLALGALTAISISVAGRQVLTDSAEPARTVRFAITMPAGVRLYPCNTGTCVAISPDGARVAFVGSTSGTTQIYVRALDDLRAQPIAGTDGGRQPFFSPDGRWLGFWAGGRIQKVSLERNIAPAPIVDIPLYFGATWTANDLIVFSDGTRMLAVPAAGGAPRVLGDSSVAGSWPVALAPPHGDDVVYSRIVMGSGLARRTLAIVSTTSGKVTLLNVVGTAALGVADDQLIYSDPSGAVMSVRLDAQRRVSSQPVPIASDVMIGSLGIAKAALSLDGTLVFLNSGQQSAHLVVVDETGAAALAAPEARAYGYPRFSPDGSRIAVTIGSASGSDVWTIDLRSSTPTRITSGSVNERPEWTHDGARILFRTDRADVSSIWWQSAEAGAPASPFVAAPRVPFYEAVMSPDGRAVVYQRDSANTDVMYRMMSGDTTPKAIAVSPFIEHAARVSPDGHWVAFVTNESGQYQVVVQPFPGPGRRVGVSIDGATEPVWGRGNTLYYRDGQRVIAATWAVSSGAFVVTRRTPLFDSMTRICTRCRHTRTTTCRPSAAN
jgi:serine/threonine-protein kinase